MQAFEQVLLVAAPDDDGLDNCDSQEEDIHAVEAASEAVEAAGPADSALPPAMRPASAAVASVDGHVAQEREQGHSQSTLVKDVNYAAAASLIEKNCADHGRLGRAHGDGHELAPDRMAMEL